MTCPNGSLTFVQTSQMNPTCSTLFNSLITSRAWGENSADITQSQASHVEVVEDKAAITIRISRRMLY